MAILTTFLSLLSSGRTDPASDVIPFSAPATFSNGCRMIRCITVGSFTGVTISGNPRTITMFNPGEQIPIGFISITNVGSGTYEAYV